MIWILIRIRILIEIFDWIRISIEIFAWIRIRKKKKKKMQIHISLQQSVAKCYCRHSSSLPMPNQTGITDVQATRRLHWLTMWPGIEPALLPFLPRLLPHPPRVRSRYKLTNNFSWRRKISLNSNSGEKCYGGLEVSQPSRWISATTKVAIERF
jgi:hypothetical protein